MDLPLCKICGERHRLGHCPEWDGPPPLPNKKPFLREWHDAPKTAPQAPQADDGDQAQAPQQDGLALAMPQAPEVTPVKPKFDRNAYQRELMRQRRAKARHEKMSDLQANADPAAPS